MELENRLEAVQVDWQPGCAEDELLLRMFKVAEIPHYFSFQVRHDHEVEFRIIVDLSKETKALELLKEFQDKLGNATIFNIHGGKTESFEYEPVPTEPFIPEFRGPS